MLSENRLPMNHLGYFLVLIIVVKLLSTVVVETSYVPDEYWQSLEVAHRLIFGYGHVTWEWSHGIRSYFYPSLIAGIYKCLAVLKLDNVALLTWMPRILQAVAGIIGDVYFWFWYREQTSSTGRWAVLTSLTSFFWLFTASRTLTNTMETVFTIIGLYKYPWHGEHQVSYLWFVGLACMVRPTAAIVWIPLTLIHVWSNQRILIRYILITLTMVTLATALDSVAHGQLIFTWWNFLQANIFQGVGAFYGSHPLYWYLIIGLPVVLGIQLVPFVWGCYDIIVGLTSGVERKLLVTIAWVVACLSCVQHKEFRFLLPILPMCWFITARKLGRLSVKTNDVTIWFVAFSLLVGSFVPLFYFGRFHQRGTLDVMPSLALDAAMKPLSTRLLFLMPCHSTPLYSHLHVNVSARFLTCEPDFSGRKDYMDEADVFYLNQELWLKREYHQNVTLPSHIIAFDSLVRYIQGFLNNKGYSLKSTFFHTHLPEGRVGENVVIYRHSRYESQSWQ